MDFSKCGNHSTRGPLPAGDDPGSVRALHKPGSQPLLRGAERRAAVSARELLILCRRRAALHSAREQSTGSRGPRRCDGHQRLFRCSSVPHTDHYAEEAGAQGDALLQGALDLCTRSPHSETRKLTRVPLDHQRVCELVLGRNRATALRPPRRY